MTHAYALSDQPQRQSNNLSRNTQTSSPMQMTAEMAAKQLLLRRKARRSMGEFTKQVFATVDRGAVYKHNWHIDCVCEYLEACHRREIQNLIINMPPRFMKSICVTIAFPAWSLGHNPSEQILAGSFSAQLSSKHSADCRLVMQSPWYRAMFPETIIKHDQNEKTNYETTMQGHRVATSVGGTATGRGGNILILDDPINPKKAESEIERKASNEWVDQTWSSRANDPKTAVNIIVMQRLHQDDTTGHVLEQGDWEQLTLDNESDGKQTIVYGDFHVTREPNELLHEERFDAEATAKAKTRLGSYGYAGQYQQRPSPKGGGMVKLGWFYSFREKMASANRIIHSWDTAQKVGELNDFTVGGCFHDTPRGHDLVDVVRRKVDQPDLVKLIKDFAKRDNPDVILIEDKSSGSGAIQELRKNTSLPIIAIEPEGDKVMRMSIASPFIEAGNIGLPEEAEWLHDLKTELESFPNSTKKDQADMISQYINWVNQNPIVTSGEVIVTGETRNADW